MSKSEQLPVVIPKPVSVAVGKRAERASEGLDDGEEEKDLSLTLIESHDVWSLFASKYEGVDEDEEK